MSDTFARPTTIAAMAVMTIATVGGNVLFGQHPHALLMLLFSAPYLALISVGWWWCERRGRVAMRILLGALGALTLVLVWASEQALFLLVLPPLLLVVLYAGVRWGVIAVVVTVAYAAVLNLGETPVDNYLRSTGFVPGAIVAVAFAALMVRQRQANRELADLAATRERNRIARDIHDSVGHYLTVVHVQIEAARAIVARDPAAADECLHRAQDLARDGLGELRRSVSMLRESRAFDASLARLIEDARAGGLIAVLEVEGTPRPLAPAVEVALYRAAQEALTNVQRHARATRVTCTLRHDAREVRLRIVDDGTGASSTGGGFGLAGMRERVEAVGGTLAIEPGPGFTIDVRVPI
jgi:signal transduction histidine kinase